MKLKLILGSKTFRPFFVKPMTYDKNLPMGVQESHTTSTFYRKRLPPA